jgi:hypothetical protein
MSTNKAEGMKLNVNVHNKWWEAKYLYSKEKSS